MRIHQPVAGELGADGVFTAAEIGYNGVRISFSTYAGASAPVSWVLQLAPPEPDPFLAVGSYPEAGPYGFPGGEPGILVYQNNAEPDFEYGSFNVYEATYAPNGAILSFHTTFIQYANGSTAGLGSGRAVASDRVQVSASTSSLGITRPNTAA